MAIGDVTASAEESTQPTQEVSQQPYILDPKIWASLIPCNPDNVNLYRMDFLRPLTKYTIGRGSRKPDAVPCDFTLPKLLDISRAHCTIRWNGEDSPLTSEVIITNLDTTFGTWVRDEHVGSRESKLLKDFDVITFGQFNGEPGGQTTKNNSFFVRIWHMDRSRTESRSQLYERYDISDQELGQGSYATVYKALHRLENEWYAVKLFPGGKNRDITKLAYQDAARAKADHKMRHFQREIDILKSLRHRHVVRLKEYFIEDGGISVVLELVSGGDLHSYLEGRPDPLFEHEAQRLTYQICDALAYMHRIRVVHRDLKPQNVLLTNDLPPNAKVADFGMAKVLDSLTILQTKCGTPLFVAPEVLHSTNPEGYDKVVDSWSLGVTVFMMLTKKGPFYDDSHRSIDWGILHDHGLSDDGHTFLSQLLEYDPRQRMSAERASVHPWLADERARDSGFLSRHHSSATVAGPVKPVCGVKRKNTIDKLSGTSPSLAVNEEPRPPAKRARKHEDDEEGPRRVRQKSSDKKGSSKQLPARPLASYRTRPVCSFGMDEVPGLGLWRHARS